MSSFKVTKSSHSRSMQRPTISSAAYHLRATPPPLVGRNPTSRLDLVYKGSRSNVLIAHMPPWKRTKFSRDDLVTIFIKVSILSPIYLIQVVTTLSKNESKINVIYPA